MRRIAPVFFGLLFTLIFTSVQAQTTASGSLENMMGYGRAVAVSDSSVFIGEPANAHQPGVVYVYRRSADGWAEHARLQASDGKVGDGFGAALAAAGNRLLVGSPEQSDELGAAYVFERSPDGTWNEAARVALPDTGREGAFGASVALRGNLAFIGAPGEQDGAGAVYVYERTDSGTWSRRAHIVNPDTSRGINFGMALAVDESRLLVGAPRGKGGAVHVYHRNQAGKWTKKTTLASNRVNQGARFGSTLSLRGDIALIGAPRHASGSGAVFVYRHVDGEWSSGGNLVAYDSEPRYRFGASLARGEATAWVGAPGAQGGKGALYRFKQDPSGRGWASVKKIEGPTRGAGAAFGATVAVGEGIAVSGLVGADYGAGTIAILEQITEGDTWDVATTFAGKGSSVLEPITGGRVECDDGTSSIFGCSNVDLLSFMPTEAIGGSRGVRLNDIWGWTDPKTGREYALVGRMDGTSFVDVSDPQNPVYVGNLPKPDSANASIWRDIKVYKNHAYVVADNAGKHGMQVVDLTDLRNYEGTPLTLEEAAHYDNIHSAHNVVINTDTGFAFVVGSSGGGQTCGGGLHMVNIQNPTQPTFAGCFSDPTTGRSGTGYTHDAQCVTYHGPDDEHQGDEICFGANETDISIADVTNKDNPKALSTASYPDYGYVHQGWLTENHRYFFQNDELDEITGKVDSTRTLIWDVSDLENPQFVGEYFFDNASSDHNLYIKGDTMYQSNYVSGLQVVDISNPEKPVKTGFFDTAPFGKDTPGFSGTWSNYPFFDSGIVIMSSSQEGLFVLDPGQRD